MSFIDREKLIQEAETCRETTGAFVSLIQSQPNVAIHINLNDTVKFRLTEKDSTAVKAMFGSMSSRKLTWLPKRFCTATRTSTSAQSFAAPP